MKKLLFLGVDTSTPDALVYAKSKGVYTIITDYLDKASSPLKSEADECWQFDVKDFDALEQHCRENGVTGIYAGNNELCLDCCKALCERLSLPFYASEEGWKAARDKEIYKNYCRKAGLDIPQQYWIGGYPPQDTFSEICFPAVVKPADSCAQKGFTIVRNKDELWSAVDTALSVSEQKKIIVEDYIEGNVVTVTCCIRNGMLKLNDIFIGIPGGMRGNDKLIFGIHDSKYNADIVKNLFPAYERVIREMNCRQGPIFFQSILRGNRYYQLEIGYRLDGIGSWKHIERLTGVSPLKYMVNLALGEEIDDKFFEPDTGIGRDICTCAALWGKAGRIQSVTGKRSLYSRSDVIVQWDRYQVGDTIPNTMDMRSIALILEIFGESQYEISEKLKEINHLVHYFDDEGNDLLVYHDDLYEEWEILQKQTNQ